MIITQFFIIINLIFVVANIIYYYFIFIFIIILFLFLFLFYFYYFIIIISFLFLFFSDRASIIIHGSWAIIAYSGVMLWDDLGEKRKNDE